MTKKLQRQFADSLYDLVMKSPENGEPMGIWKAGYGEDGNIEIGIGDQHGTEFWILKFETREASEIEVKRLSFDGENDEPSHP